MPTSTHLTFQLRPIFFLLIIFITTLSQVATDIYLPSLPAMTQALAASKASVQLTLSLYMLGLATGAVIYGPLSDREGRRKVILIGVSIGLLGNLMCVLSPSIGLLLGGRVLQGLGLGACTAVGRTMLRDLYQGAKLAQLGSYLGMASVVTLAAVPIIGGYIQVHFSWRGNFIALFIFTACMWLLLYAYLPETNKTLNPHAMHSKELAKNYWRVLSNKIFAAYLIAVCCTMASVYVYLTVSPFLFQNTLHLSPVQFGWTSLAVAGSVFTASFINTRCVIKQGISRMLHIGISLMLVGSCLMLLLGVLGFITTWAILLPLIIFIMGANFTLSNSSAAAMLAIKQAIGSASAIFVCGQVLVGAIATAAVSLLHETSQIPLAIIFIVIPLFILLILKTLGRST